MTDPVTPSAYTLTIEPDLDRFTFTGTMQLDAVLERPADAVRLDCAELAVWQCRFHTAGAAAPAVDCPFSVDPAGEALTVHLPETVSGPFTMTVDYTGRINDRMAGFYRSRIRVDGAPPHIAVTQFQESDARRAFPCLDHPARKAVFTVELVIPASLTAVANTDVAETIECDDGRRRVRFAPTPRMSTYLLFFGVGPFDIHTDTDDPRIRAVCLPGTATQTEFGRTFGHKALAYGEAYYDIAYPLDKLDLIAVPDFAFGAMENWGAITFRENLLLHVPGVTSREGEARICEVIAHEITHQWFGNLVTPEDWKYLWLNESFATYFGYGMVDHHHPDWNIWPQFIRSQTETALARDALHETFAIEMPGDAQVAITTSTAPIIYSKGASILRQLEAWIGADAFRDGLRRYLNRYAYGCAASHHLWESLGEVSGLPVADLMRSWVTQPGFPRLTVRRSGDSLAIDQARFTYLPGESTQRWLVPLSITIFTADEAAHTQTLLLESRHTDIALPPGTIAYKVNPGQTGFCHVHDDNEENRRRLGDMIENKTLPEMDRWGLQNDGFAMVKAGLLSMTDYLAMAEHYMNETAYLPLSSLMSHLFEAYRVLTGDIRTPIARTAGRLTAAGLSALGEIPVDGEPQTTAMLRDTLMVHAALIGDRPVLDRLGSHFSAFMEGRDIPPDIYHGVMTAGAVTGDPRALDAMIARFEASPVEHERMTLASALGSFGRWPLVRKALAYTLERVPDRLRFIPLVAAAGNPAVSDRLWPWFEANCSEIMKMHPLLFERVVAAVVPGPGLADADHTAAFCERLRQEQPRLKDVLALSLERLTVNAAFRRRESQTP